MVDLPHGAIRHHPARPAPIYLPPPAGSGKPRLSARLSATVSPGRRRPLRRVAAALPKTLALAGLAFLASGAGVADTSLLAALSGDRPTWLAAVRAPDPGIALSPNASLSGTTVALGEAAPAVELGKGDRLMTRVDLTAPGVRGTLAPLAGLYAAADVAALPRVAFVRPPQDAPALSERARATASSMLTAYAADRADISEPFELLLGPEASATPSLPYGVAGNGRDHWWSDRPLPASITSEASLKCLTEAIYFEARGESELGQEAVAQVVVNRVKNPAYPDDICAVVYQNRTWYNRCQFTFACDRIKDVVRDPEAWATAEKVAKLYTEQKLWLAEVGAATHYHATRVSPKWANIMRRVKTIGDHVFYMTRHGGWT
ncbi:cell wall hydrolase [Acuticoccus mangrovi]|uniref:Cell wall hydrolase n=1 Tax=Acuticoccus mangrovi TaxID=2796142 RepID=A0A934IV41_9HYPH|nr:cell wall hydrolase [Acuticoccus mangrovi]MBJ3778284.1 cell wall hydrolase [Acuticoccus mangrovi]